MAAMIESVSGYALASALLASGCVGTGEAEDVEVEVETTDFVAGHPVGFFDYMALENNGTTIRVAGWTCDPTNPHAGVQVRTAARYDIYDPDGGHVDFGASAQATQQREQAVADLCAGNPYHGFNFTLPCTTAYAASEFTDYYDLHVVIKAYDIEDPNSFSVLPRSQPLPYLESYGRYPDNWCALSGGAR